MISKYPTSCFLDRKLESLDLLGKLNRERRRQSLKVLPNVEQVSLMSSRSQDKTSSDQLRKVDVVCKAWVRDMRGKAILLIQN
jgi:hypothetical protein